MTHYRVLTVAIVLVVLTAGCLGGGTGAPATPAEGGSNGDGSGGSGGGESGDGAGDGGSGAGGGAGDGGDLDLTDPEAALRDAGSFTSTWQYAGTDADGVRGEIGFTYYADLDAGRTHIVYMTGDDAETTGWEVYSTEEVSYTRFGSGENAFYQVVEEERDVVSEAISHASVYGYGGTDSLQYEGTETFDGVTVQRYEISETDSALWAAGAAAGGQQSGDVTVTDFEYVVLVDQNGLARYESWSYTGQTDDGKTVTAEWEYTLTKVGSTTVEEPDWLAEAEDQVQTAS